MWQSYGKGKTRSELQAAHAVALTPADRNGLTWTEDELKIVEDCRDASDHDIALLLKRTVSSVRAARCQLGKGHKRA